jgi:hypothetical protein
MDETAGVTPHPGGAAIEGERDRIQDRGLAGPDRADDPDQTAVPEVEAVAISEVGAKVAQA